MASVPSGNSFIVIGGKTAMNKETKKIFGYVPEHEGGGPGGKWVVHPYGQLSTAMSATVAVSVNIKDFYV